MTEIQYFIEENEEEEETEVGFFINKEEILGGALIFDEREYIGGKKTGYVIVRLFLYPHLEEFQEEIILKEDRYKHLEVYAHEMLTRYAIENKLEPIDDHFDTEKFVLTPEKKEDCEKYKNIH